MTYHIRLKKYSCPSCKMAYIPYEKGMLCPNCKTEATNVSEEYLTFIDELIGSLVANKIRGGMYIPYAWSAGSFAEHIQSFIFQLVETWDKIKPKDEITFLDEYLNSAKWDKNTVYLKEYVRSIALKIFERKDELKISWRSNRFIIWLRQFFP